MKLILLNLVLFLSIVFKLNQINSQENENNEILYISINGLVCDFCARSIEKLFKKKSAVKNININLEEMLVTIFLKKGETINNQIINQIIIDSGYDVKEIRREN
tara:strand:+ start:1379 stop:1690 length:312 start_codon:yes stop_codon:yes gene_type:complete